MAPTVPANGNPKQFLATDGFRIFKMKRVQIRRDEGPEGLAG